MRFANLIIFDLIRKYPKSKQSGLPIHPLSKEESIKYRTDIDRMMFPVGFNGRNIKNGHNLNISWHASVGSAGNGTNDDGTCKNYHNTDLCGCR